MIAEKIKELHSELPGGTELVAVSKFHPAESITEAYNAGQRIFGESRVQELLAKIPQLPADIRWHFIGHLQTNKVKQLVGKVSLIESVDSEKLLRLIDRESEKAGVKSRILLQIHVAKEETKFGFYPDELTDFLKNHEASDFPNVEICGIMGMASNTDDKERVRSDFKTIADTFRLIKEKEGDKFPEFRYISMGMSGDWPIAVEEGSNLVRIGTAIFGPREY